MMAQAKPSPGHNGWAPSRAGAVRSLYSCHFDIVDGCQLACLGCPNSTLQPKVRRIAHADFRLCLGNIDVKAINLLRLFNYGEPLLHHDLPCLLEEIPRQTWRAYQVELSTNAQFVDWPVFEDALKTGVLTRLVVSCDGDGTAEDYERLRPPSRWKRLVDFLTRASELRDRHQPSLELTTRTICTDPADQERWRALCEPLGWRNQFRGWQPLPEARAMMVDAEPGKGACGFQTQHNLLYVTAQGEVVPCCIHPKAGTLGNLKTETFNAIMAGAARAAFTAAMKADRAAMPVCGACSINAFPSF